MNIPTFSKVPCYDNEGRGHANYIPPMQNVETVQATPHVNSDVADGVVQTCGGLAMTPSDSLKILLVELYIPRERMTRICAGSDSETSRSEGIGPGFFWQGLAGTQVSIRSRDNPCSNPLHWSSRVLREYSCVFRAPAGLYPG